MIKGRDAAGGNLFFYTIDTAGTISIVEINVATCKSNVTAVTGLATGQNDVRGIFKYFLKKMYLSIINFIKFIIDIKYDSANDMLYMVFPNPMCMHGSLNQVNARTGAVVSFIFMFMYAFIILIIKKGFTPDKCSGS